MEISFHYTLFAVFAFVLGAAIGSFLNVGIYRLPRDISIKEPRRSFCPVCKTQIPWQQNIPLVSWLFLRGRCAKCGARIAFRYFGVELLTALLFLAIWEVFPWKIAIAYWVFVSILLIATFVDLEHFIIPDQITIGGTIAGIVASFIVPELMNTDSRLAALVRAALAAALGYVILWIVLEGGKIAFGKKRVKLDGPTPFTWTRHGDDADFVVGEERSLWSDYFAREKDRLLLHCDEAKIDNPEIIGARESIRSRAYKNEILEFHYNRVRVGADEFVLDTVDRISGVAHELEIPREAMGRGDLKFLAAIGAFLGWRGVLFSIFAGSVVGSIVGLATLLIGKRVWSAKLPFGPYLAFGALTWIFFGDAFVRWYFSLLNPL
ncbi:MAG: prepilin peptidase [Verrucomicrobiota bacterium]|nr:prepilin peptidase [Verrucomicrobiota bacterium]